MLALWHGEDQWSHAVVWLESVRDAAGVHGRCTHVLHTEGGRVRHETGGPEAIFRYTAPTSVRTTVGEMVAYFQKRLLEFGGDAEAFQYLGVEKPKAEVDEEVKPESEELADLYERAARLMKVDEQELRKKYAHLNRGLQAMNLRNRLRGRGFTV